MFDYETAQTITSFNPLVGNYSMMMYLNMDYARSRGIEILFRQTAGRFFSGDASFTYSVTTGKSSNPDDNVLVEAGMIPEKPLSENYLSWDEPFRLIANLRFHFYEKERPRFFINNWSLNAHIEAQSGRRYTESVVLDTVTTADGTLWYIGTSRSDNPYGEIADPYITVDLKFTKDFYYKDLTYGFYIDAKMFSITRYRAVSILLRANPMIRVKLSVTAITAPEIPIRTRHGIIPRARSCSGSF
ncbi:MAG: hypothetical protein U5N56_09935 [Candidatus Marinimicrobia bacterium]|nr:hypothetical protein [Candidatus Neomarinimicrobiota bacterium]